ncbi:MAG: hypothetical protein KDL87_08360, partial [Verrucomicrobiae bacterium]|nr:hypothetical protein [Verrucomicrobiae bacterium]
MSPSVRCFFRRLAAKAALTMACLVGMSLWADEATDSQLIDPLQPIENPTGPLATDLDFSRFNKKEGFFDPREHGEVLHFFDRFLAAQGISNEGTAADLHRLHELIEADVKLTRKIEKRVDDQYDALDKTIEKIEEAFEDQRYGKEEDEKGTTAPDLDRLFELRKEIKPLKDERKRLRTFLDQEEPALDRLESALRQPENARQRIEACGFAVRTLYSLFSDRVMADHDDKDFAVGLRSGLQYANCFLGRPEINSVPYYGPFERQRSLGSWKAKQEATNLCDPAQPGRFLTAKELAKLSPVAVGDLDLSPDNPMWHTRAHMETVHPDTWSEIENYIADRVTEDLMDKKKFRKAHPEFRYDLHAARRVLFWDGVKTSATSPKIETVDALGQEWKMKWADEAVVEPFGNRLRVALGAKFCDLTYVDVGGASHLLILPGKEDRQLHPGDAMPLTVEELITVMEESTYHFNVRPFIRDSGTITAGNADTILRSLPAEGKKGYRKQDLIGRTWVSFKESMVEAKHDVLNLGGPAALFCDLTYGDRALRQAFLFSLWMEDKDNKEANFRTAWLPDFAGKPSQYIEYFHDPGFSFGGLARSAELNNLKVGDRPGGFLWLNTEKTKILGSSFQIYRPGVWSDATY